MFMKFFYVFLSLITYKFYLIIFEVEKTIEVYIIIECDVVSIISTIYVHVVSVHILGSKP